MISFIGTDLDGTLLNSQSEISQVNRRAIRLAVSQGMQFAICSGRTLNSVKQYLERDLKVPGYKILLNGAVIVDPNGHLLNDHPLDPKVIDQLLKGGLNEDFKVVLDSLDTTYISDPQLSGATYYHGVSSKTILVSSIEGLREIAQNKDNVIYKVCFSASPQQAQKLIKIIESYSSLPVEVSRSGKYYYEINPLNCTKFSALQKLSTFSQISINDFMCFGDYGNDLEMLRGVGHGGAMENAMPEVKKASNLVTKTNNQDGVAWMLNKVLRREID